MKTLRNRIAKVIKVQEKEACPICTDDFEEPSEVAVLACDEKHFYHDYCINSWISHNKNKRAGASCPMCRLDIAESLIRVIDYKYPVQEEEPDEYIEEVVEMKMNRVTPSSHKSAAVRHN